MTGDYLRRQAEWCLSLARECFDLGVSEQLRMKAAEFQEKAREAERRGKPVHFRHEAA